MAESPYRVAAPPPATTPAPGPLRHMGRFLAAYAVLFGLCAVIHVRDRRWGWAAVSVALASGYARLCRAHYRDHARRRARG